MTLYWRVFFLIHAHTMGDACERMIILREKKEKIAQSKAAGSGRKEKSRHVQEPLRKHGKCMHLLKNKIKTRKTSVLSAFPMFAIIICDRRSLWGRHFQIFHVRARESTSILTRELLHHFRKLRQFLNWGKHRKMAVDFNTINKNI